MNLNILYYIARAATPARITLGVTTVLTITTLMGNVERKLPHTSYPKVPHPVRPQVVMLCEPGHRHLPLGLLHLHLRGAGRVLHGRLPGEEEDDPGRHTAQHLRRPGGRLVTNVWLYRGFYQNSTQFSLPGILFRQFG